MGEVARQCDYEGFVGCVSASSRTFISGNTLALESFFSFLLNQWRCVHNAVTGWAHSWAIAFLEDWVSGNRRILLLARQEGRTDVRFCFGLIVGLLVRPSVSKIMAIVASHDEQVVSKRRKMIMDMGDGMTMEIREELKDRPEDADSAVLLLMKGLEAGPFSFSPKWYNDDENFSRAVSMSLGLKETVVLDGIKLPKSIDERQPLLHGSFRGFRPDRANHQRVLLLAAWLKCNPKVTTLDLRGMGLDKLEVDFLCHILKSTQCIVTADMRENGEMGEEAANMLVEMVLKADNNTIGSLCGVTKTKISLSIPRRDIAPTDLIFIATELEANSWAESNSGKGKPTAEVRRRSSHSYGDWSPLLFAAREGIPDLCSILIKRKADINQKDQDKLNPGYTALITAATRGDLEMVKLLVEADADLTAGDRNGKTAQMVCISHPACHSI